MLDSNFNQVHDFEKYKSYWLNKQNAVIYFNSFYNYPSYTRIGEVHYVIQNVAVWFAVVMALVGVISLALIIVGICYARCKYQEWKERKMTESNEQRENKIDHTTT